MWKRAFIVAVALVLCCASFTTASSGSSTPASNTTNTTGNSTVPCVEHEGSHWTLPVVLAVELLCLLIAYALHRYHLVYIPESGAFMIVGIIVGVGLRFGHESIQHLTEFNYHAFFTLLLPPIIFDSGYSMKKRHFFRNFGAIIAFAVIGTIISTVFVSMGILLLGYYGLSYPMPFAESFMYGSLISAVDPVATLAVFAHVGAPEQLNSVLAGESILNDAVAIVLYRTFETFTQVVESVGYEVGMAALKFFYISFGSIGIGIVMGLAFSWMTKFLDMTKMNILEQCLLMTFAYLTYTLPEALTLSGIMALLFFGQVVAHYGFYNLSVESKVASRQMIKTIATLTETAIFVFLGTSLFGVESINDFHWDFIGWTMLLIIVGRILNVFPLSAILNCFRSKPEKIRWRSQLVMAVAGLRGAIAFALAMNFTTDNPEIYRVVTVATLAVVLITTFVFGAGTLPLLKALKITASDLAETGSKMAVAHPEGEGATHAPIVVKRSWGTGRALLDDTALDDDTTDSAILATLTPDEEETKTSCFSRLDYRYFKPALIRAPEKKYEASGTVNPKDVREMSEIALARSPEQGDREEI